MYAIYERQRRPRTLRSDEERLAILQEYAAGKTTVKELCVKHRIGNAKTLYDWRDRFFPPQIVVPSTTPATHEMSQLQASDRVLQLLNKLPQDHPVVIELQRIIDVALDF